MNIKYIKDEKNEAEIGLDNLTIAEILRIQLTKDEQVDFAAWKREHPSKSPILKVKTRGKSARKAVEDAVSKIEKELDNLVLSFKKGK